MVEIYREVFEKIELQNDDTLLIGSNITKFGYELYKRKIKFNPDEFIDELQKYLNRGTILFPTFNYDFCRGEPFDYKNSLPQNMGALSNRAFKREDFKRTKHPIFSFMVWGKYQKELVNLNNISSFGIDSPFGFLYLKKAKMLLIDVEYNHSFTYLHFVEQQAGVDYRYNKIFEAPYIDENGKKEIKKYSMLVRDLKKGVVNNSNPLGKILEEKGISKVYNVLGESVWRVVDLNRSFDIIKNEAIYNPHNLVKFENN